jgi:hypothetical protein
LRETIEETRRQAFKFINILNCEAWEMTDELLETETTLWDP